jgi:hypothetical protein
MYSSGGGAAVVGGATLGQRRTVDYWSPERTTPRMKDNSPQPLPHAGCGLRVVTLHPCDRPVRAPYRNDIASTQGCAASTRLHPGLPIYRPDGTGPDGAISASMMLAQSPSHSGSNTQPYPSISNQPSASPDFNIAIKRTANRRRFAVRHSLRLHALSSSFAPLLIF